MNGKIIHIAGDGTQTDVSEGVQALYDLVLSSMNWGSGFLSYEDALPVAQIGRLAGFEQAGEAERYVQEDLHRRETAQWQTQRATFAALVLGPHDHVWSSAGRCMWPECAESKPPGVAT